MYDPTLKIEIYHRLGRWRWRVKAGNGEKVAVGQAFTQKHNVIHSLEVIFGAEYRRGSEDGVIIATYLAVKNSDRRIAVSIKQR